MFESLSINQRAIVFDKSGKFVVRACPGSGKTFCVAARLARLISEWKKGYEGIAAVSFTNVAWQEIERKYKENFKMNHGISFPHFLGTIDSFINKFIFLPYGHLVLKCKNRPTLVGEPHGIWTGKFFSDGLFDNISFNINGEMFALYPRRMSADWASNQNIITAKNKLLKAGYAIQQDANYFAMKILEQYPEIAKSLALRFPFLIVDEAQDTSEIQMRIIDLLIANGLNEVVLIGDPDQAIFEWNEARPGLLNQKFESWTNSITLNESRRSSQKICDFTFNISSLPTKSASVDEAVKAFNHQPKIITYNNNLPHIVNTFLSECSQNGITVSVETVSVIYRSKDLIHDITGIQEVPFNSNPWATHDNYTKDFAKGKFLYDNGNFKTGFKSIEKAIIKMLQKSKFCSAEMIDKAIDKIGFTKHRTNVFHFLNILPQTNISIGSWVDAANAAFKEHSINYELSIKNAAKCFSFNQIFLYEEVKTTNLNYRIGTVHSVKGETFDATLLILKTRGVGKAYNTILNENILISVSEELRIAYVGMTRPRKILVIAVPDDVNKTAWENKLTTNIVATVAAEVNN